MRRLEYVLAAALAIAAAAWAAPPARAAEDLSGRLDRARAVYEELVNTPDHEIPQTLQDQCKCVAVIPHVLKAAIGFGGRYGKGFVSCRNAAGAWSPPAPFTLAGGSWGFQLGAEATDVVLYFMTERGAKSLLESKFTLGASAGLAGGPVGRSAEASTDGKLEAEIYSYARSKGLFAGLSLDGAHLAADAKATQELYGQPVSAKTI